MNRDEVNGNVVTIKRKKKVRYSKVNMATSNVALRTKDFWNLSSACRSPIGKSGITFEEAAKKIRSTLQGLGPHRKAVKRLYELQEALITGASKKCRKSKTSSRKSTPISFMSERRIQQIPTAPSQ